MEYKIIFRSKKKSFHVKECGHDGSWIVLPSFLEERRSNRVRQAARRERVEALLGPIDRVLAAGRRRAPGSVPAEAL
jgi:hypothetical protein